MESVMYTCVGLCFVIITVYEIYPLCVQNCEVDICQAVDGFAVSLYISKL